MYTFLTFFHYNLSFTMDSALTLFPFIRANI